MQSLIFFKVVNGRPSQTHRTKVEGQMCMSGMRSVSLHRLLHINNENKTAVVSLSPLTIESEHAGQVPLIMSTTQFSLLDLKRMRFWETDQSQLVVRMKNHYQVRPEQAKFLPMLLQELALSPAGSPLDADWANCEACAQLIARLESDSILEGPPWKLTLQGTENLEVGVQIASPRCIVQIPQVADDSSSVAQLFRELDRLGWTHTVVGRRRAKKIADKPYIPSKCNKVWYTRRGVVAAPRQYLLALLKAQGDSAVPHFAPLTVYKDLLRGVVEVVGRERASRARPKPVLPEGADWPEDVPPCLPRAPRAMPRKRRRRRREPSESSQSSSASSSPAAQDTSCSGPSSGSSSSSSSASEPDGSDANSAHGGSTRSTPLGEPGAQAGRTAASSMGHAQQPDALLPDGAASGDGHRKRPGKGHDFGSNRITAFKVKAAASGRLNLTGYRMTCNHPLHKDEGAACTKSRSQRAAEVEQGSEETGPTSNDTVFEI